MKIITRAVLDMNTMRWVPELEENFEYNGIVALCDRAAQGQAKDATKDATAAQDTSTQNASNEHAALSPFYSQEMHAEHGFDPTQTNELLTSAMAGTGGSDSALKGDAELQAARTRNPSGFTKSLDEAARDADKARAGASEGIAAQDVMGAKQLNQQGAAGEAGLFGEDTGSEFNAMGQRTADINADVNAGNSGWLQNMNSTIKSVGSLLPKPQGCWCAAAVYGGWDDPRVDVVRNYLFNIWAKQSFVGHVVTNLYTMFGEKTAKVITKSPVIKVVFKKLFDIALHKAQQEN